MKHKLDAATTRFRWLAKQHFQVCKDQLVLTKSSSSRPHRHRPLISLFSLLLLGTWLQQLALAFELAPSHWEATRTSFDDDELDKSAFDAAANSGNQEQEINELKLLLQQRGIGQQLDKTASDHAKDANLATNETNQAQQPLDLAIVTSYHHEPGDAEDKLPTNLVKYDETSDQTSPLKQVSDTLGQTSTANHSEPTKAFLLNGKQTRGRRKSADDIPHQQINRTHNHHHQQVDTKNQGSAQNGKSIQPSKMVTYSPIVAQGGAKQSIDELTASQSNFHRATTQGDRKSQQSRAHSASKPTIQTSLANSSAQISANSVVEPQVVTGLQEPKDKVPKVFGNNSQRPWSERRPIADSSRGSEANNINLKAESPEASSSEKSTTTVATGKQTDANGDSATGDNSSNNNSEETDELSKSQEADGGNQEEPNEQSDEQQQVGPSSDDPSETTNTTKTMLSSRPGNHGQSGGLQQQPQQTQTPGEHQQMANIRQELLVGPFGSESEAPASITLAGVTYRKSGISSKIPANQRANFHESLRSMMTGHGSDISNNNNNFNQQVILSSMLDNGHLASASDERLPSITSSNTINASNGQQAHILYLNSQNADLKAASKAALRLNGLHDQVAWLPANTIDGYKSVPHRSPTLSTSLNKQQLASIIPTRGYGGFSFSPQNFAGRLNGALLGTSSQTSNTQLATNFGDWPGSRPKSLPTGADSLQMASAAATTTALDMQPELSSSGSTSDNIRAVQHHQTVPSLQIAVSGLRGSTGDNLLLKNLANELTSGGGGGHKAQTTDMLLESLVAESSGSAAKLSKTSAEQQYLNSLLTGAASEKHYDSHASKDKGPIVIVEKNVKPAKYHLLRAYLKLRRLLRPTDATYVFPGAHNSILR